MIVTYMFLGCVILKDRNCYGGGVLMYLNESLSVKYREDLDFDKESISVEIKIGNYKLFFCNYNL